MWDFWWIKWHRDRFSLPVLLFPLSVSFHQCSSLPCQYHSTNAPVSPVSIIPLMLHAHLHINTTSIRRTSGRGLRTFEHISARPDVWGTLRDKSTSADIHDTPHSTLLKYSAKIGPRWLSRCSESLRAGRSRNRIPVGGEIFRVSPNRFWGPPILLQNGYCVYFSGVKAAGAWPWLPPHPI